MITPHIPVQFWLLVAIGFIALAPATYIFRYLKHAPSRQEVGRPPEDLSWWSPRTYGACLLALIVLAGLAVFIFTPAAAAFAHSPSFWPILIVGVAVLAGYQVVQGFRTGNEEPMIRGFYTSYNRATQPKRYWASMVWNSAVALMMLSAAGLGFVQAPADARRERCYDSQSAYPPRDVLAACNQLLEKIPSNGGAARADAFMARGNAYYRLDDCEHAVADYSRAIQVEPNDADLLENRGSAYLAMRRGDEALADFNESIRLKADWLKYFNRGYTYQMLLHDPRDAIVDYSAAIRMQPDSAEMLADRGYCYGWVGDYRDAIADFSQVIRLKPKVADGHYYRALAYRRMGETDQAAADFRTALQIDPHLNRLRARKVGSSL